MIPLFVSTELVLERITVQAQQDIWLTHSRYAA